MERLTISEEAYDRLKSVKHDTESVSEVILRLTEYERDLYKGFGEMADVDGFREIAEETRENLDRDRD